MRPLYEIAREIRKDWKNVSPYAAPLPSGYVLPRVRQ